MGGGKGVRVEDDAKVLLVEALVRTAAVGSAAGVWTHAARNRQNTNKINRQTARSKTKNRLRTIQSNLYTLEKDISNALSRKKQTGHSIFYSRNHWPAASQYFASERHWRRKGCSHSGEGKLKDW